MPKKRKSTSPPSSPNPLPTRLGVEAPDLFLQAFNITTHWHAMGQPDRFDFAIPPIGGYNSGSRPWVITLNANTSGLQSPRFFVHDVVSYGILTLWLNDQHEAMRGEL